MREGKLYIIHKHHLRYEGNECLFDVMGALSMDISRLNVSLHLSSGGKHKHRLRLDLYNYADIQRICTQLSEEGDYSFSALESDLLTLTQLLEEHREGIFLQDYQAEQPRNNTKISLSLEKEKEIVAFLQQKNLLELLSDQVGEIGIVGEENNRLLLFLFGLSYKTSTPLHALVQSSSGSGKSHLINSVADCFPKEDVISFSRITGKSLYHYKKDTLKNKLILIQDFDGLDDEALYAFRELQSYGKLTSSSTGKDAFGNHIARLHTVEAHFASFGASTKSLYQDNASRSVILSIDESYEQSERIMQFIPPSNEQMKKVKGKLANCIRLLKDYDVTNPFEASLVLPSTIPMARRLSNQLKAFVKVITFLFQYQRETDSNGNLLSTEEDVQTGIRLFFEVLWIKMDELEPHLRSFYEKLESYLQTKKEKTFRQREIRNALGVSRSALARHLKTLLQVEYLFIQSGNAQRGYVYVLNSQEEAQRNKESLKNHLQQSVSQSCPTFKWDTESPKNAKKKTPCPASHQVKHP